MPAALRILGLFGLAVAGAVVFAAGTHAEQKALRPVPQQAIIDGLASALDDKVGDRNFEIRLAGRRPLLYVAADAAADVVIEDLEYDRQSGRFVATVAAPVDHPQPQRVRVAGRVQEVREIPVLRSYVGPGEVITKSNIEMLEVPARRLGYNVVASAADLIGYTPKRTIQPGQPVRSTDIQRPELVAKGAMVTMSVASPGMTLTATGRAVEGGAAGDVIAVMNTQSRRTIQATVIGQNRVEVAAPANVLASRGQ